MPSERKSCDIKETERRLGGAHKARAKIRIHAARDLGIAGVSQSKPTKAGVRRGIAGGGGLETCLGVGAGGKRKIDSRKGRPTLGVMRMVLAKLAARPLLTVSILGCLLLLSGNWILPLIDRDEPRFAEASREMIQREDWIVPWFNGQHRFDKPPLIYWCQMASFRLFGECAWAARVPSSLFAIATALLLVGWGRRLGSERAGFYAALMWLSCLQVLIHGRLALADMAMVFFATAAARGGWELTRPNAPVPRAWGLVFYVSLALGFLAKGPVAWLPVVGVVLACWLRPEAFRITWPVFVAGLGASLLSIGVWGIPALITTHGEFFRVGIGHHVIDRSLGVMEGHGVKGWLGWLAALPMYFLTFFLSFFPWALAVPAAFRAWWIKRRQDAEGWYLVIQAAPVFVVFTLIRTKLPHYTLPAFPCVALWLSLQTAAAAESGRRLTRWFLGMAALTLLVTIGLFSLAKPYLASASLWSQVKGYAQPGMELGVAGFTEPSIVWEFRQAITNYVCFLPVERAEAFWDQPGPRILIVPTDQIKGRLKDATSSARCVRARGIDTVQFKEHDLTAVIRQ